MKPGTEARINVAPVLRRQARGGALARLLIAGVLLAGVVPVATGAERAPVPIAVLDFEFVDTSGEAGDPTARHRGHLAKFMLAVRGDLEREGRFRVVPISCDPQPCFTDSTQTRELVEAARRAGARFVLLGGFHRASTLVQWARAQVIDVEAEQLVFDRLLSFRGDGDQAWQRAEAFLMKELRAAHIAE